MISTPLIIYCVLGPLTWLLLFVGTAMARVRMGRLLTWRGRCSKDAPAVTILIPAKDEAAGITSCVESVLAQRDVSFDVIAIDDRSVDHTGRILDVLTGGESRLRVFHIEPGTLPTGWLGKCNALHVGSEQAKAAWLLFVDSDVTLQPDALSATLSIALERDYHAVSILTRLQCDRFIEKLMLPLLAGAWSIMHTVSLTNEDRRDVAAANGQFFLIRRDAYEAVGGHAAVRDQITEDVELMRRLKSAGYTVRFFMGSHLAATRMHSTLGSMLNGWSRIYSGTARRRPWRILGAIFFIAVSLLSVFAAIPFAMFRAVGGDCSWLSVAIAHYALATSYLALIYYWSGNPARSALLAPISAILIEAILAFSLWKCWTGRVKWRDTVFEIPSAK